MREQIRSVCILWMHGWATTTSDWSSFFSSSSWSASAFHHLSTDAGVDVSMHRRAEVLIRHVGMDVARWFRNAHGNEERLFELAEQALDEQIQIALKNGEKVIVGGWSLGGELAILMIERIVAGWRNPSFVASEALAGLIILSSSLRFCHPRSELGWPERVVHRMIRQLEQGESSARETLSVFRSPLGMEGCSDTSEQIVDAWSVEGLVFGLRCLIAWHLEQSFARILGDGSIPVAWGHGMADTICPPGAVPEVADPLEVFRWADLGHAAFREDRERVAVELVDWIERVMRKLVITNG